MLEDAILDASKKWMYAYIVVNLRAGSCAYFRAFRPLLADFLGPSRITLFVFASSEPSFALHVLRFIEYVSSWLLSFPVNSLSWQYPSLPSIRDAKTDVHTRKYYEHSKCFSASSGF